MWQCLQCRPRMWGTGIQVAGLGVVWKGCNYLGHLSHSAPFFLFDLMGSHCCTVFQLIYATFWRATSALSFSLLQKRGSWWNFNFTNEMHWCVYCDLENSSTDYFTTVQSAAWPRNGLSTNGLPKSTTCPSSTHTVLSCYTSTGWLPIATPVRQRTKWPPQQCSSEMPSCCQWSR